MRFTLLGAAAVFQALALRPEKSLGALDVANGSLAEFGNVAAAKRPWTECGQKGNDGKEVKQNIVNGEPASECDWRWQVSLRQKNQRGYFSHICGGMLIHDEWVLTAAHCLIGMQPDDILVVAGEFDRKERSDNEQRIPVYKIYMHPQYDDRSLHFDMGLIKLKFPIEATACVGTVCLPDEDRSDARPSMECWITGWGRTSWWEWVFAAKLQEAKVQVMSNKNCKRSDYPHRDIDDSMLCAQGAANQDGEHSDACQGDSGGPLVCKLNTGWTVFGATSWGYGCGEKGYPGVWARVHHMLPWIDETMTS